MTFVRYVLIQLLAYCIDLGSFLFILKSGLLGPFFANVISKIAAGFFAFVVHRRVTFRAHGLGNAHRQAVRYFLLLGINVPLSSVLLMLALRWVSQPTVAKVSADVAGVFFTYWISKVFVFGGKGSAHKNSDMRDLNP